MLKTLYIATFDVGYTHILRVFYAADEVEKEQKRKDLAHGSVIFREVLEIQHRSWSYKPDEKSNRDKMRCCKADKGVRCR